MESVIDLLMFLFFLAVLVGLVVWVNAIDNKALLARYGTPEAFPAKRYNRRPKTPPTDRKAADGSAAPRKEPQPVAG